MTPYVKICTPVRTPDELTPEMAASIRALLDSDIRCDWEYWQDTDLSRSRCYMISGAGSHKVNQEPAGEYTHWLMDDSDNVVTPNTLRGLLARNVGAVGAAYEYKGEGHGYYVAGGLDEAGLPILHTHPVGTTGLHQVGWVGEGAFLIDRATLMAIGYPWFRNELIEWVDDDGDVCRANTSTDIGLCAACRAAGIPVYLDCDNISPHVPRRRTMEKKMVSMGDIQKAVRNFNVALDMCRESMALMVGVIKGLPKERVDTDEPAENVDPDEKD